MIKSFRHKGLGLFHRTGQARGLQQSQVKRLAGLLALLDTAKDIDDVGTPGSTLHPLRSDLAGLWSIRVDGNYRLIFRFDNGDAYDLDIVDYH